MFRLTILVPVVHYSLTIITSYLISHFLCHEFVYHVVHYFLWFAIVVFFCRFYSVFWKNSLLLLFRTLMHTNKSSYHCDNPPPINGLLKLSFDDKRINTGNFLCRFEIIKHVVSVSLWPRGIISHKWQLGTMHPTCFIISSVQRIFSTKESFSLFFCCYDLHIVCNIRTGCSCLL